MVKWLSLHWSEPIPARWLYAGCWLAILSACLLRAHIGAGGTRQCTGDLFCFVDGGWRVLQGQVPYKDFFTDMGTLVHLLTALGLRLAHNRVEGVGYGQAILGLSLGIWSWVLTARRLHGLESMWPTYKTPFRLPSAAMRSVKSCRVSKSTI